MSILLCLLFQLSISVITRRVIGSENIKEQLGQRISSNKQFQHFQMSDVRLHLKSKSSSAIGGSLPRCKYRRQLLKLSSTSRWQCRAVLNPLSSVAMDGEHRSLTRVRVLVTRCRNTVLQVLHSKSYTCYQQKGLRYIVVL